MNIKHITSFLEEVAPLCLQETYDNSGLLIGSANQEISKALITLDVTDEVIDEALKEKCDLIIAHHPLIFKGIKSLTGKNYVEKIIVKAIKNDLSIYAIHTNLDNIHNGVNGMLAKKIGLKETKILSQGDGGLKKLVTFCPVDHAQPVSKAIFEAGAGHIGKYDSCSFNMQGKGSFRGLEGADPFVGKRGEIHYEKEDRIETIVPEHKLYGVISAMKNAHPYEEVAYDVYPLDNKNQRTGAGMIGLLKDETDPESFLKHIKATLNSSVVKYNSLIKRNIKKVAICGGSGSFLIHKAYQAGADIFITGDVKYHDYFDYNGEMIIADAGHYETEQFTKDLLHTVLKEKFPTFALLISRTMTNPVNIL